MPSVIGFGGSVMSYWRIFALAVCLISARIGAQTLPSFPGAEGFGAEASGGRGGRVLYVTTLAADPDGLQGSGNSGSLNWALRQSGARTVLFKVSGVIDGLATIRSGDVTIAGQSSPGGIIVRGLICGVHYGGVACDNVIVRHLHSRPACQLSSPGDCPASDDALRLDGLQRAMIDHVSLANASDEAMQISWASKITLQDSILAETVGEHAIYGGILINYSNTNYPLDGISLVRNLFYRIKGRLPEITCESSSQDDQEPRDISACQTHTLHLEVANNGYFDPGYTIEYNPWVDDNPGNGPFRVDLNLVGNVFHPRSSFPYAMAAANLIGAGGMDSDNNLYVNDNHIDLYPALSDYALFYCCNDFATLPSGNQDPGSATHLGSRNAFPTVTYRSAAGLLPALAISSGAQPHDPMDRRIAASTRSGIIPDIPHEQAVAADALDLDFPAASPPAPPLDSDADGMPDAFEAAHAALGVNPQFADNNGLQLSLPLLGQAGYTNLEVYLELLARQRSDRIFDNGFD
ncbi:MAG TPA: hypothetical protein VFN09_07850 [Rhodanobacteraceae bacterium]|nr:hypothetical protein [Rhodanobacteraceae bacterium]